MNCKPKHNIVLLFMLTAAINFTSFAQFNIDVEGGIVSTGYNDVKIPGNTGTPISFSDDLSSSSGLFSRVRVGYLFGDRNELLALYAPLNINYKGFIDRDVVFQGQTFTADSYLSATYKFNSYRATYRYYAIKNPKFDFALGLTIKVRDALIGIKGNGGISAEKTDLGLVPLINFWVHWQPTDRFGIMLDGDALAAPQGRAEDVLAAVTFKVAEKFTVKAGYRILEGGADNATVYTFSLFHYGVVGAIIKLE